MSSDKDNRALPQSKWNSFAILTVAIKNYLYALLLVCGAFMRLRMFRIELFDFDPGWLLRWPNTFWPVFEGQYQLILKRDGRVEANNYALFALLILVSVPVLFVHTAVFFSKLRRQSSFPNIGNWFDVVGILVLGLCGTFIAVFDRIALGPTLSGGFYPDQYGFFYFRQGILLFAPIYGALIFFVLLLGLAGRRNQN